MIILILFFAYIALVVFGAQALLEEAFKDPKWMNIDDKEEKK